MQPSDNTPATLRAPVSSSLSSASPCKSGAPPARDTANAASNASALWSSRPFQRKFAAAFNRETVISKVRRCCSSSSSARPSTLSICRNLPSSRTASKTRPRAAASMVINSVMYLRSKIAQAASKAAMASWSCARSRPATSFIDEPAPQTATAMRREPHAAWSAWAAKFASSLKSNRSPLTHRVLVHAMAASKISNRYCRDACSGNNAR
mmetsp:Transcript_57222/g.166015  ORF Transcript_57222/g.166015 Transcript_57222/m.166015 type:complete len:209 (-) Transcript_57222:145-771(-)